MAEGELGTIVSWRVPGNVQRSKLRASLLFAGLDPDLVVELQPRHALARALREMHEGRVIRRLRREEDKLFFQLTREHYGEHEIVYERECQIELDLPTGKLDGDDLAIVAEAKRLLDEHLDKRLTSDLTRLVQRIFDSHKADLIPIRDQGGVYFVPERCTDLVDKVRALLDLIGGKLRSFAVRLGCADTSESVAESMSEYLNDLIQQFRESVKDVTCESRKDVIARREAAIGELRQKLDAYRGLLAGYAERLAEEIEDAERALLLKLMAPLLQEQEGELAHA